jgi:hypothetical protein
MAKKPADTEVQLGRAQVVVVSREVFDTAWRRPWAELIAACEAGEVGYELRETTTSDGLVNLVRPAPGFASLRPDKRKEIALLFEQGW